MEQPVAEDASVLICSPIEGMPLEELVEHTLVDKARDANAE